MNLLSLLTTSIITTLLLPPIIRAQDGGDTCYYPDGSISTLDAPCYSDGGGGICCPLNHYCLDNGLCYHPDTDYFGRYTCTDPEWGTDVCPGFCTYSGGGNEALLQCLARSDQWCCNGNGQGNCCAPDAVLPDGTDYFSLSEGEAINLITSTPGASASQPTAAADQDDDETSDLVELGDSRTVLATSTRFPSAEFASSIIIYNFPGNGTGIDPDTIDPDPADSSSSNLSLGTIIGIAVGIPVLFILAAILLFSLWRRRNRRSRRATPIFAPPPASPPLEAKFSDTIIPGAHATEIHGSPVAHSRERFSELPGTGVSPPSSWGGSMGTAPGAAGAGGSVSGGAPSTQTSPIVGMGRIPEDAGVGAAPPSSFPQELNGTPVTVVRKALPAARYTAYRQGYQAPADVDGGAGDERKGKLD